jgi:hypothetical protein
VDPSIQTETPIYFTCENFKSIALTAHMIFTNLLAEDTWEEIIILQDFLERQEVANASPSQEDPYFSHIPYIQPMHTQNANICNQLPAAVHCCCCLCTAAAADAYCGVLLLRQNLLSPLWTTVNPELRRL